MYYTQSTHQNTVTLPHSFAYIFLLPCGLCWDVSVQTNAYGPGAAQWGMEKPWLIEE